MGWNLFGGCCGSKHFIRRNVGERELREVRGEPSRSEVAEGNVGDAWGT
jgi:hypothetical protein